MPIPEQTPLAVGMILRLDGALNTQYQIVAQSPGIIHNWFLVRGKWTMSGIRFDPEGTGENYPVTDLVEKFSIIEQ